MRFAGMILLALVGLGITGPTAATDQTPVTTIKDGILDEIKLYVAKLPGSTRVVIRPFSASDADLTVGDSKKDETKKMQVEAPGLLAEEFVVKLKDSGTFTDVAVLTSDAAVPADAILVSGKFIEMDPGSRAKRYFVGFGAGKSGVTVEGSVKGPDGAMLATFKQRRIGVMGVAGGDSMGKLRSDAKNIAEDIAKFLSAWATGKKLK
jgi:hypothetical protein